MGTLATLGTPGFLAAQGTGVAEKHAQAQEVDRDDAVVAASQAVPDAFPVVLLVPWRCEVVNGNDPPSVDGVHAP